MEIRILSSRRGSGAVAAETGAVAVAKEIFEQVAHIAVVDAAVLGVLLSLRSLLLGGSGAEGKLHPSEFRRPGKL